MILKKENRKIEFAKTWFKKSIEERFKIYDINYTFVSKKRIQKSPYKKLSNVPKGYPGGVIIYTKGLKQYIV